jgi:hypothetical protein
MSKPKHKPQRNINKAWTPADRQDFADRNVLRAQTIPNKKRIANRKACRGRVAEW